MKETTFLEASAELMELLRNIPAFEPLGREELHKLLKISKLKMYKPEERIFEEGTTGAWVYFLVRGAVTLVKDGKVITTLQRRGDVFGEMGVISTAPRSASAYAKIDTICLSTDFGRIEKFREEDRLLFGYLLYRIFSEILSAKLKSTTDELLRLKGKSGLKFW